jgi:hypothetical protein
LSEEVTVFIEGLDRDDTGLTREEFVELQEWNNLADNIVDYLVKSRETLIDSKLEALERLVEIQPNLVRKFLDRRFTRELVDAVPDFVRRTLQLSRMSGARIPSKITNGYLREAVRTYIVGLPQASVALSRAALEQALKEGIGYQSTNTFVEMRDLLDEAESAGVIDHANRVFAREVADAADNVLHEKPATLKHALDVLTKMRGVLQFIYSQE